MDAAAASKRRKIKRGDTSGEAGDYSLAVPPPPPPSVGMSQSYDGRERGDRKGALVQRGGYAEEPVPRMHAKETANKINRRDNDAYP